MAFQTGIFKISGTIDGINFYQSRGKHLLRRSNPVSRERVATDPAFARTRENNSEFATAVTAAKLLRHAINVQLLNSRDGDMVNRLNGVFSKITKSDPVSDRGKRSPALGDLDLLRGFGFNQQAPLHQVFVPHIIPELNRFTGHVSVTIPAFNPEQHLRVPAAATHFQLVMAGVELDFVNRKTVLATAETALLLIHNNQVEPIKLEGILPPNSRLPQVMVFGIRFTEMVNGQEYDLKDKNFNTLQVVLANSAQKNTDLPGDKAKQEKPLHKLLSKHIYEHRNWVNQGSSIRVRNGLPLILNQGVGSGEEILGGGNELLAQWREYAAEEVVLEMPP